MESLNLTRVFPIFFTIGRTTNPGWKWVITLMVNLATTMITNIFCSTPKKFCPQDCFRHDAREHALTVVPSSWRRQCGSRFSKHFWFAKVVQTFFWVE
jgi:hypothetical protein